MDILQSQESDFTSGAREAIVSKPSTSGGLFLGGSGFQVGGHVGYKDDLAFSCVASDPSPEIVSFSKFVLSDGKDSLSAIGPESPSPDALTLARLLHSQMISQVSHITDIANTDFALINGLSSLLPLRIRHLFIKSVNSLLSSSQTTPSQPTDLHSSESDPAMTAEYESYRSLIKGAHEWEPPLSAFDPAKRTFYKMVDWVHPITGNGATRKRKQEPTNMPSTPKELTSGQRAQNRAASELLVKEPELVLHGKELQTRSFALAREKRAEYGWTPSHKQAQVYAGRKEARSRARERDIQKATAELQALRRKKEILDGQFDSALHVKKDKHATEAQKDQAVKQMELLNHEITAVDREILTTSSQLEISHKKAKMACHTGGSSPSPSMQGE